MKFFKHSGPHLVVEAVEALLDRRSDGPPPRDRSRLARHRSALEKMVSDRDPQPTWMGQVRRGKTPPLPTCLGIVNILFTKKEWLQGYIVCRITTTTFLFSMGRGPLSSWLMLEPRKRSAYLWRTHRRTTQSAPKPAYTSGANSTRGFGHDGR